jgi:HEAT repeat protein
MRWLRSLCVGVLVVNSSVAADSPIALALRAIKMTEHDLSFSKTNVESELVLPEAQTFLQQPLVLPAYAEDVLNELRTVTNLVEVARDRRARRDVGAEPRVRRSPPTTAQEAVNLILDTARSVYPLLPKPDKRAYDAFVLSALHEAREDFGVDPELLRRDDALELQDTELADAILNASDHLDRDALMTAFRTLAAAVEEAVAGLRTNHFAGEFQTETDTDLGKVILGGIGPNVYTNEAFLIVDLGGDDVYSNRAAGAVGLVTDRDENNATYVAQNSTKRRQAISVVVDLNGNDRYVSRAVGAQGSGIFGVGILVDCGGDDVYEAKHLSQGAGFFGCGLLADYGGHDKFVADTFAQGAAAFGAGMLWQRGGDTQYRLAHMGQGFGATQGLGLLLDEAGNDSYVAGGKYPCDWLPGHNFSLAQGFGFGMRPFAGGGIGILCDLKGDDRYEADVYGQGASYWYSVGLLLDAEGNDRYDAHQYCQGAGIHLSSGALVDWAGHDSYSAGHICQGAAHDYAVGMLMDRAGNDRYRGDTTAQGAAINNSFALLLDEAGDDSYTGTDPKQSQAAGHDGDKREYGSIALLLDLAGKDWYSQGQSNNAVWLKPWYGAGLDSSAGVPPVPFFSVQPNGRDARATSRRLYNIAPVDPHHPIEQLLRVAMSDKPDAGKAWDELKQEGTNALAYLVTRLDSPNVLVRAKTEELIDHLSTNSIPVLIAGLDSAKNDEVARLCCYFLARFDEKARVAIPHVLPLLKRDITRPVAFYTLGHIRAREAFEPAMAALNERELVRLRAVQALGKIGDRRATEKLIAKLDDELYDVRYAAEDALVGFGRSSIGPLRAAFSQASKRARPHMIEALARLKDRRALALAEQEYRRDDPLVREAVIRSLRAALAGAK